MMSSSKMQVSLFEHSNTRSIRYDSYGMFCGLKPYTVITFGVVSVYESTFTRYAASLFFALISQARQRCCYRLADGELVPYVVPSPPNDHHCGVHLLRHIAGASDHGEPQSLRPQGSSHSLQLRRGGSLALHVL